MKAAKDLCQEWTEQGAPVPDWCLRCTGLALSHTTPAKWRRLCAGEHQLRQQDVEMMPLSRTGKCLLDLIAEEPEMDLQEATYLSSIMGAQPQERDKVHHPLPLRPRVAPPPPPR